MKPKTTLHAVKIINMQLITSFFQTNMTKNIMQKKKTIRKIVLLQ